MSQGHIETIAEEEPSDLTVLQENDDENTDGRELLESRLEEEVEEEEQEDSRVLQGDGDHAGLENRARSSGTTSSGRLLPSQNGKACMSRMSHSAGTVKLTVDNSSSDEDEDGTSSVLITELREDGTQDSGEDEERGSGPRADERTGVPPGRITQIRLGRTRSKKTSRKRDVARQEEDEWDTDLEGDSNTLGEDEYYPGQDLTGRLTYTKLCEKLGVVPVSYFTRHIRDHEIIMRYHGLGPHGTHAIAKVLKDNITLERLNLAGNWMEGEGAMYMSQMLAENDYITELSLAENKLGNEGILHVSKMLTVNSGLRRLDLSNNELSDKDTEVLADALEQNKFLRELILSHNRFGQEAGEILGPAIGANDVLDSIDLSWNQIRKKGAVAIARGLKENIRLKVCNLAWNGFGPEGGAAIGDALCANETLQELDLSGNRLDGAAAASLARGIRKNEDLLTLKVGNNPITTKGAVDIATALHDTETSQLSHLDLTDIPVEYEFTRLCEAVRRKRDVTVVSGPLLRSGNTADDIGKPAVDPFRHDPLLVLREYIVVNDLRIFEFLQKYDEDHSYSVTQEQFALALEDLGVTLSREQLDELAQKLDTNSDGRIFYGDIFKHMDTSAQKAQEKGYMGIMPKTPALQSRGPSFVTESLNGSTNQPLLQSQVIAPDADTAPGGRTLNNSMSSAVSLQAATNKMDAASSVNTQQSVQGATTVGRFAFSQKEISVE